MKAVSALSPRDFDEHPVWQYSGDDDSGEPIVRPVTRLPVSSLTGKLVGVRVHLPKRAEHWALVGNIDSKNRRLNEHFATISMEQNGRWFHLARYHDHDYSTRGPAQLAQFLGLDVDEVFPIAYDLTPFAIGDADALTGIVAKEPSEWLTRAQIIALAVP